MMSNHYLALIRIKVKGMLLALNRKYIKALGLNIGIGGSLGNIICDWPHNLNIGNYCTIQDEIRFDFKNPFSGKNNINIGNRVFIGYGCIFNCTAKIIVGNNCLIASRTIFVDIGHQIAPDYPINEQAIISKDIVVGEDVWIGVGCIILQGVVIGRGSVIGAGSLVNKSIPEYEIWAGSPAKYIRSR